MGNCPAIVKNQKNQCRFFFLTHVPRPIAEKAISYHLRVRPYQQQKVYDKNLHFLEWRAGRATGKEASTGILLAAMPWQPWTIKISLLKGESLLIFCVAAFIGSKTPVKKRWSLLRSNRVDYFGEDDIEGLRTILDACDDEKARKVRLLLRRVRLWQRNS